MKKKLILILAVIAVISIVGACLAGCSDDNKLRVVTNAEFAPFESEVNGKFVGFDMDLIREIGKIMGKKVKISTLPFEGVISAINSGTHDVAIAALTINPERVESVDFSDPYYSGAYQVCVVKTSCTKFDAMTTKEQVIAALQGTKIHVAKGQVGQAFALGSDAFGYSGIANADVRIYTSVNLAAQGVKGDEVAFLDNLAAREFVEANNGYKIIEIELTRESYGIAVKKGNTELQKAINDAIQKLKDNGKFDKLLAKYEL